eukprot:CAMPEP_0201474932 /NCGR_PEP_ID=MMETSP0151_2-20130828/426_1 /ASSEMBLY_ACC=CAM_ASM_000257 /TAXON_ID=200890 /ORGANISM="Paramoeba atlantica, Strain 621/1 / CCAP 1560/9" /LENGTH=171 /DNA_ID=CAMNT_0047854889 /DNA_START=66 /DNA_END=581 /DNA_ORIENTATION=-
MGRRSRVTGRTTTTRRPLSTQPQARSQPPARAPQRAPPQAQSNQKPGAQQQSSGPSMLGGMASSMAGSMVGSVVGHSIANKMFGSDGHQEAPQEAQAAYPQEQAGYEQQQQQAPCQKEMVTFNACLERSNGDLSSCQWAFDAIKECRLRTQEFQQQQQFNNESSSSPYDRF